MIFAAGLGSISTNATTSLPHFVDLNKAFYTFSCDGLRKIMSKFGCPPLSSPLLGRSF